MKKSFSYIFLFFLLGNIQLRADALEDLKKSIENVYKFENLTFQVNVKMYAKLQDKTPQMSSVCNSVKKGKNFYSNFMGRTTIFNYKTMEMLEVSEVNKTIVYSEIPKEGKKDTIEIKLPNGVTSNPLFKIDTSLMANSNVSYKLNNATTAIVEIKPKKDSPYNSIQFTIDKKTNTFKRLEYFLKDQKETQSIGYIVIDYTYNLLAKINDEMFNINRYVTRKGNNIMPKKVYMGYKIKKQLVPDAKN